MVVVRFLSLARGIIEHMFDSMVFEAAAPDDGFVGLEAGLLDEWRRELVDLETEIARLRSRQVWLVRQLESWGEPRRYGFATMRHYLAGTCDISAHTAAALTDTADASRRDPVWVDMASRGTASFDRTVAMSRLAACGADDATLDDADKMDIAGVRRLTAHQRRMTRRDEHQTHQNRFVRLQPRIDDSGWDLSGFLPAVGGKLVEDASPPSETPSRFPPWETVTRGQRNADALVILATGTGDGGCDDGDGGGVSPDPSVTIFVDARQDGDGDGYVATVAAGPRVGPATLEALLCHGRIDVIGVTRTGIPVTFGDATTAIPARIRRYVLARDGGCTAQGCTSRYRLEPHHIQARRHGGNHDPANLTTLCWYHHHVVVHQGGYHIDPKSPPKQRRFTASPPRAPP